MKNINSNKNKSTLIKRDISILMSIKGEIDLRTKSETLKKKKYSRKLKHKTNIF